MQTRTRQVAIVSADPETLDGLEIYLRGVDINVKRRRRIEECSALTSATTQAIIIFPDDFPWEAVMATVADLATRCRTTLRVLVTGQPKKYESVVEGGDDTVIVVPRPVWGWTILDAIRSHADRPDVPKPRRRGRASS